MTEEVGQLTDGGSQTETSDPQIGTEPTETPKFTVKVNGVEQEVTQEELLSGYMRGADYTRKTQAISAQRQELERALQIQKALETNPEATLKVLASEYEIPFDSFEADDDDDDPVVQKIRSLEAEIGSLRSREVDRMVQAEISELKSKYDVADDQLEEVMEHATRTGKTLKDAHKDLFFEEAFEVYKASRTRKAAEQRIQEDKQAAGVVHLGESAGGGSTKPKVQRPRSLREAYALAKQGVTFTD